MIKQVSLVVVSPGIAAAAVLPSGLVHAAPAASSGLAAFGHRASLVAGLGNSPEPVDWGPNYNCWHVHIFSNTPDRPSYVHTLGDSVYHANHTIAPYFGDNGTRAVKGVSGRSANIHVSYEIGISNRVAGVIRDPAVPNGSMHVHCNDADSGVLRKQRYPMSPSRLRLTALSAGSSLIP